MSYKPSFYNVFISQENQIYNSFTKARIKVINPELLKVLLGKSNTDPESFEEFSVLKKHGFFVDCELDEQKAVKYVFNRRFFTRTNLNLILLPTLGCNFACPYCFESSCRDKFIYNPLYFEALKKHILSQKGKFTQLHIGLFGGEPLLMKDKLFEFVDWVREFSEENNTSYDTSIVTNGSLINENVIDYLVANNCQYLQITIDGSKETHNKTRCFADGRPSFDLLMNNLQLCAEKLLNNDKFQLILRFNLKDITVEDVKKTLSVIDPKYRKKIQLLFRVVFDTETYCGNNENKPDDLDKFANLGVAMGFSIMRARNVFLSCEGCGDTNVFHVLPDLSIWKCVVDLSFEEACIGKMDSEGNIKWNLNKVINWYDCCDYSNDSVCYNCKLSPDCLGGCVKYRRQFGKRGCQAFDVISGAYKYQ